MDKNKKKFLDVEKINDILWSLKVVVLNEPENETIVAVDKFLTWIKNRETWIYRIDEE